MFDYTTETLPELHSQVTADYSNVFTMNPPTADVTQELWRTPRTCSMMTTNFLLRQKDGSLYEEECGVFCDEKEQGADCADAGRERIEADLNKRNIYPKAIHYKMDNKLCEWKSQFTTQSFRCAAYFSGIIFARC